MHLPSVFLFFLLSFSILSVTTHLFHSSPIFSVLHSTGENPQSWGHTSISAKAKSQYCKMYDDKYIRSQTQRMPQICNHKICKELWIWRFVRVLSKPLKGYPGSVTIKYRSPPPAQRGRIKKRNHKLWTTSREPAQQSVSTFYTYPSEAITMLT